MTADDRLGIDADDGIAFTALDGARWRAIEIPPQGRDCGLDKPLAGPMLKRA